jgi:dihydrodipicolinate synthase/N-acetylneuraminate lyase
LKAAHPQRFAGIKDSSGDSELAKRLGSHFKTDLVVLTGNDRLLGLALDHHASGCITAMANLFSPSLRQVWEAHLKGTEENRTQAQINAWRSVLDGYQPFAPTIKAMLARLHDFPEWPVRPPLLPLDQKTADRARDEIVAANQG